MPMADVLWRRTAYYQARRLLQANQSGTWRQVMLRVGKMLVLMSVLAVLAFALAGCAALITDAEGGPSEPIVVEEPAVQDGGLRAIEVQDVQIQVGVGSPIPVDVMVSGGWPGLCAQLAQLSMNQGEFSFDYELLATAEQEDCPPDMIGLPFGMRIPLNVVELPEGTYTVTVNGVSGSFEVPVPAPAGP